MNTSTLERTVLPPVESLGTRSSECSSAWCRAHHEAVRTER